MRFRPYPLMTLLAIAGLGVLVWLGNWQWGRYSEKVGRPPAEAAEAPAVVTTGFSALSLPAHPPQRVYGIADGEPIWRRYVLATRTDTGAPVLLAVDAIGGPNPVETQDGLAPQDLARPQDVRVFARRGEASPRNAPDGALWYSFDRDAILAALGAAPADIPVAEPVTLTVRNSEDPAVTRRAQNPYAAPRPIDPLPPERHFGYALTWWGLAAALVGVYLAFHMAQGRLSFGSAR